MQTPSISNLLSPKDGIVVMENQIALKVTPRDNRKGRHTLLVLPGTELDVEEATQERAAIMNAMAEVKEEARKDSIAGPVIGPGTIMRFQTPPAVTSWRRILQVIQMMFCVHQPLYDVLNGFFLILPVIDPGHAFKGESKYGGGITGFTASALFLLVSVLAYLEAINAPNDPCCAYSLSSEEIRSTGEVFVNITPNISECHHHHQNRTDLLVANKATSADASAPAVPAISVRDKSLNDISTTPLLAISTPSPVIPKSKHYHLLPAPHHFLPSPQRLAILASLLSLLSTILYFPTSILVLPPLVTRLPSATLKWGNWFLQTLSSAGMFIASLLLAAEVQTRCGALGFAVFPTVEGPVFEASMWANFWGCWAFLVAGVLGWYESTEKWPVVKVGNGG
ncbi:hypothetical protein CAC42_2510 [Sphaceloma murrayae]|uniref:Uncharacterized protein n=1 Tax=Sphaceloma murrayae TaxID=2082308 RepID=A0A2K1QWQ9_9PEZI|nr:hypothetical protein CAC42_2510 [Sphaceloma murrayae]